MVRPPSGVPDVAKVEPERYDELLDQKLGKMRSLLEGVVPDELPPMEVFESARENFRMRASFATWREGQEVHYVMFNQGDPDRMPIQATSFPMGSRLINELMPLVRASVEANPVLNEKIGDVRFLTTTTGEALVTITYNRPINESWVEAATAMQQQLAEEAESGSGRLGALGSGVNGNGDPLVRFVGRSRKLKLVVGGETVREILRVPARGECVYTQTEGAFTQPNAHVCEAMLGWAYDTTRGSEGSDLCELYCGNGCFTVALAPNFRRVVATELSKSSVTLAQRNLAANQLTNVRVAALSAEDFVAAYSGEKRFHRLENSGIRLEGGWTLPLPVKLRVGGGGGGVGGGGDGGGGRDGGGRGSSGSVDGGSGSPPAPDTLVFDRLKTLFVDPPRAGLDTTCRELAATFDTVVYISCNPDTLARDLQELSATHVVKRLAAFDQFPYTHHLEAGVLLERRG